MKPWWPNTQTPRDSGPWPQRPVAEPGRSGRVALTSATSGNPDLCAATFDRPTSCTLNMQVRTASKSQPFAFPSDGGNSGSCSLLLEYGVGAATQRVLIDLRSGTYQLPPSEQVRVSIANPALASGVSVNVTAALAEGFSTAPSRAVYTSVVDVTTSGENISIPANAVDVDCWLSNDALAYGAGAPVLSLIHLGLTGFAQIVRDYTTGIWAPPYRSSVMMGWEFSDGANSDLTLDTTVNCNATVQFGIEF